MKLYIKDGKIVDPRMGVDTGEGTTLYNGTESQMAALGYEVYVPQPYIESQESVIQKQIDALKLELSETDYIAIKSIEGYECDLLYPGWKVKRANIRKQINDLEKDLNNLMENEE